MRIDEITCATGEKPRKMTKMVIDSATCHQKEGTTDFTDGTDKNIRIRDIRNTNRPFLCVPRRFFRCRSVSRRGFGVCVSVSFGADEPVSTFNSFLERTKGGSHGWLGNTTDKKQERILLSDLRGNLSVVLPSHPWE
jgi:hypothetical protein